MADDQNPELPLTPPPGGGDGTGVPGALNIQPVNIEEEMKKSYLDYSMSVIIGRALPDVRDGLKPVHRRILYTMQQMGLYPNRSTRKCARIVGDVMGKYHPHGNLAVYDALVRLAQPFAMRYPLVDGQGNFGSVDGDPPAADRYTEARLARVSNALLEDLDKATVDFRPNYDGNEIEPDVLPTRIPNLLVNGSDGIAVGMATKIPPHNLTEIVDATITLVNNPNAQLAELLKFVQGPDSRPPASSTAVPESWMPTKPDVAASSCAPRRALKLSTKIAKPSSSPKFPIRSTKRAWWSASPSW